MKVKHPSPRTLTDHQNLTLPKLNVRSSQNYSHGDGVLPDPSLVAFKRRHEVARESFVHQDLFIVGEGRETWQGSHVGRAGSTRISVFRTPTPATKVKWDQLGMCH